MRTTYSSCRRPHNPEGSWSSFSTSLPQSWYCVRKQDGVYENFPSFCKSHSPCDSFELQHDFPRARHVKSVFRKEKELIDTMTQPWSNFQYPGIEENEQVPVYTMPYGASTNDVSSEIVTNSLGQSFRVQTVLVPLDPSELPNLATYTNSPSFPYSSISMPDEPPSYYMDDRSPKHCCNPRYDNGMCFWIVCCFLR
jgi:hypothetical protein